MATNWNWFYFYFFSQWQIYLNFDNLFARKLLIFFNWRFLSGFGLHNFVRILHLEIFLLWISEIRQNFVRCHSAFFKNWDDFVSRLLNLVYFHDVIVSLFWNEWLMVKDFQRQWLFEHLLQHKFWKILFFKDNFLFSSWELLFWVEFFDDHYFKIAGNSRTSCYLPSSKVKICLQLRKRQ